MTATVSAVMAGPASAEPILQERFHDEGTFVEQNFCGVPGLTVEGAFVVDGRVLAVPHGSAGLIYFAEHIRATTVFTSVATGTSITLVSRFVQKDLRVTDNDDGTLTIVVLATGNDVLYGTDGKAIARNPGQIRFAFVVDHAGTPADPSDDEFLVDLGVVKESTGRNDDLCAAAVAALI